MTTSPASAGPNEPQIQKLLSEGRKHESRLDRWNAIESYRQALALDGGHSEVCFRLAYNLDLVGNETEALQLLEKCCAGPGLAPVNAVMNLAVLYEDSGDFTKAEHCLGLVLQTDANHSRARLFMKDVVASQSMLVHDDPHHLRDPGKAIFETPVSDFDLSTRARNCLKKMNIRTLGDLLHISQSELMAYKNFGEATMQEIKNLLSRHGLKLGQNLAHQQQAARQEVYDQLRDSGDADGMDSLDRPVDDLNLSVRARKALDLLTISTIGDLISKTEAELLGIKNFGATSLTEIKEKLTEMGLGLRVLEEGE